METLLSPIDEPKPVARLTYAQLTRTGTYSFLMALPLLAAYEALILMANANRTAQVRVGAEVWIKQVLASLGAGGLIALGVLVLVVGLAIFLIERRKHIPLHLPYFGGMLAESLVYAFLLAALISNMVGFLFAGHGALLPTAVFPQVPEGLWMQLALSLGAGLYEELLFRVLLVGGLFWLLKHLLRRRIAAYLVAAVVGAVLFSAVHYTGPFGDPFALPSFTFRFLFGLALNGLFLLRGFGIAAWTHALYDVALVTRLLG